MNKDINKEGLILSLIKDDITNLRLVAGLEELGLDSGKYYLNLCDTIFELLHIDDPEGKITGEYLNLAERVQASEIFNHSEKLEALARTIYNMLIHANNKL